MNLYGWAEAQNHALLLLATDGNDWSASVNGHWMTGENVMYPLHKRMSEAKGGSRNFEERKYKYTCWISSQVQPKA
jgi:hypothetical protein